MPDFLALDWEAHQLSGLEASTTRQGVMVRKAFVLTWPEHIHFEQDAAGAADWLKKQLAQQGVSTKSVLVCLPRESIVVRRLTVPNVPEEELPPLVQMQAATKSSTPIDQLELDFLPLPVGEAEGGRDVLMCTMAKKRSAKMRNVLMSAGLEVEGFGVSSVATAELIAREERKRNLDPAETSLIIAQHGPRVEITIFQKQCVVLSHSTQIHSDEGESGGDESLIVSEVRRSMVSLHPQAGQLRINRVWLVGHEDKLAKLANMIQDRLKCETIALDPASATDLTNNAASWPEPVAAFAGPLGLLMSQGGALAQAIDFENPRKARPKRDVKKIRLMAATAAGVILFVGLMGYRWSKVQSLEEERTTRMAQVEDMKKMIKAGQPVMESAGLVGEWDQRATQEIAQLGPLYEALPGTDLIYLVEYRFSPASRTSLGQIQAVGRAKAEADVRELFGKLAERGMKVKPPKYQQSTDSEYPVEFQLDLELPLPVSSPPGTAPANQVAGR